MASSEEILQLYAENKFRKCLKAIGEQNSTEANVTQAMIFNELAQQSKNSNLKVLFYVACLECYSRLDNCSAFLAGPMFALGEEIGSILFYKKAIYHSILGLEKLDRLPGNMMEEDRQIMVNILDVAEARIEELENTDLVERDIVETTSTGDFVVDCVDDDSSDDDSVESVDSEMIEELKLFWPTLKDDAKRKFLRVTRDDLSKYFRRVEADGEKRKRKENTLEQVITYVRKNENWKVWICRFCYQKFSDRELCKKHLEIHAPKPALMKKDQPMYSHEISQRNDGTDEVGGAVKILCHGIEVKERIESNSEFSCLLLDKRLLQGRIEHTETGGKVSVWDPDLYYARCPIRVGEHIVTWLLDRSSHSFKFPTPINKHNLCAWVAVLRCLQFACRSLKAKSAKKLSLQEYEANILYARELSTLETERRKTVPQNEWTSFGSILYDTCEDIGASLMWCTVRDILTDTSIPSLEMPGLEAIYAHKDLTDVRVINSINRLHLEIKNKDVRIDSRILSIEKSRMRLLEALTDISIFDYRFYLLPTLKEYLLHRLTGWSDGEPIL